MTIVNAVIFDLDGTLLDTIEDIADAVNAVLAELGCPRHTIEEYKVLVGAGVDNMMERALPRDRRDAATIQRCINGIGGQYRLHGHVKTKPYPGILELLSELAKRGIKRAVNSNKPHEHAVPQIEYYFPDHPFECIEGAKSDVPVKPDPQAALAIAKRLGVEPAACIFIGDSDIDMQTATNAGMYAVGALWGFRTAEELAANGAKALLAHPLDMLDLLE